MIQIVSGENIFVVGGRRDELERIVACVNFCAGIETEQLIQITQEQGMLNVRRKT